MMCATRLVTIQQAASYNRRDNTPDIHSNPITKTLHQEAPTTNQAKCKDSSATNIHMHHPRLADYFEDFTRPHTSQTATLASSTSTTSQLYSQHNATNQAVTYGSSSPALIPSFLPIEDIYLAQQYQPPNPEDEDDVVPDQHAAFGITRAMERRRETVWRDLGLEGLVSSGGLGEGAAGGVGGIGRGGKGKVRVKEAGRLMGGKRVVCLR
ncbi:hypothetical protein BDV18DRAFT_164272 [Aspergillus unguis]